MFLEHPWGLHCAPSLAAWVMDTQTLCTSHAIPTHNTGTLCLNHLGPRLVCVINCSDLKKYIYFSVCRCFTCMYVCELHADNVHRNQKRVSEPIELPVNIWFAYLFMHLHTHSLVNISWVERDHRRKCLRIPSVGYPLEAAPSGSRKADSWEPWPLSI